MKQLIALILLLPVIVASANVTSTIVSQAENQFDAANKLYAENKFVEAANAYESIATNGVISSAVYFNLGNAQFKARQLGHAIAAYHQTASLTPRDPDLIANMKFARNQVQGPTLKTSAWQNWMRTLTLNEWTWLCVAGVWMTFALLIARQLKPALAVSLANWTWLAVGITTILCANLIVVFSQQAESNLVITVADATIRTSPLDQAPSTFVAHDGAELRVLDTKNDWFQVTDGTTRIGWVKSEHAVLIGK